jgi:hypothetical protein
MLSFWQLIIALDFNIFFNTHLKSDLDFYSFNFGVEILSTMLLSVNRIINHFIL